MKHFFLLFSFLFTSLQLLGVNDLNVDNINNELQGIQKIQHKTENYFTTKTFIQIKGRNPKFKEKLALKYLNTLSKFKYQQFQDKIEKITNDTCDLMILKDGKELLIRVTEVSDQTIKYKKCDFLDGPQYSKDVSDVFMIKYRDGRKEIFENNDPIRSELESESYNPYSNENTVGIFFIVIILGFFLGLIGLLGSLFFKKGPKRKVFFQGWGIGFVLIILILLVNNM